LRQHLHRKDCATLESKVEIHFVEKLLSPGGLMNESNQAWAGKAPGNKLLKFPSFYPMIHE